MNLMNLYLTHTKVFLQYESMARTNCN